MRAISTSFSVFFCKQKTAYEMRISDWSSDVCSSDLSVVKCLRRSHCPSRLDHPVNRFHFAPESCTPTPVINSKRLSYQLPEAPPPPLPPPPPPPKQIGRAHV